MPDPTTPREALDLAERIAREHPGLAWRNAMVDAACNHVANAIAAARDALPDPVQCEAVREGEAVALLRTLEWSGWQNTGDGRTLPCCPTCRSFQRGWLPKSGKHTSHCSLAAILSAHPNTAPMGACSMAVREGPGSPHGVAAPEPGPSQEADKARIAELHRRCQKAEGALIRLCRLDCVKLIVRARSAERRAKNAEAALAAALARAERTEGALADIVYSGASQPVGAGDGSTYVAYPPNPAAMKRGREALDAALNAISAATPRPDPQAERADG